MPPDLAARWAALLAACGVAPAAAEGHRAALVAAYAEPHRAYHRLTHVAHLLAELDAVPLAEPAVAWAAWYHDLVYVPGRPDNEARSAARARVALEALGLAPLAPRVVALVLATREHRADPADLAAALFLDADLAILGADPDAYRSYAEAVRREHRAVPDLLYARGRRRFLAAQLGRAELFQTRHFRERYEAAARENLAAELARLSTPSWRTPP
jgi:predicted metal-dependent HD superfamily phosphohydrolase